MPQLDYFKGFLIICPYPVAPRPHSTTSIHSFILFRTIASKHKCGGVTSLLSVPCPSLKPFKGSKSQNPSLGPQGPARTGSLLSLDAPGLLTLHALGTLASFRPMEHSHFSFACADLTVWRRFTAHLFLCLLKSDSSLISVSQEDFLDLSNEANYMFL